MGIKTLISHWLPHVDRIQWEKITSRAIKVDSAQGIYYLKPFGDRPKIAREHHLLPQLVKQGIPVEELMLTLEGKPWVFYENKYYGLYKGLPGQPLGTFDLDTTHMLGLGIAQLHQGLRQVNGELRDRFPTLSLYTSLKNTYKALEQTAALDSTTFKVAYTHAIDHLKTYGHQLPTQLIHRDSHPCNFLFSDGQLTGIVDFELICYGPRLFDLCYCATAILSGWSSQGDFHKWPPLVAAICKGYSRHNPLTPAEKASIFFMFLIIQSLFIGYWLGQGNTKLAQHNMDMLAWIYEHYPIRG